MEKRKGTNLSRAKVENQTAIREIIHRYAPISRAEIAEKLSLTLPTITVNVNTLIANGLIREVATVQSGAKKTGRSTSLLDIVPESRHFLGIEVRGSFRRVCIADYRGNILRSAAEDVLIEDYDACITCACDLAKKVLREARMPKKRIAGVGICVPGLVDEGEGILKMHPGYGWRDKNIRQDVARLLNYNGFISVENNACARAYGAHLFCREAIADAHSYAYLYVSSGIACPLIDCGSGFHAASIGIGEIGHMVVDPNGPDCICGNRGCLEAFSGEWTVLDRCRALIKEGQAPLLAQICPAPEHLTIAMVLEAQNGGEASVAAVVEDAVKYLGIAVANVDNLVRPGAILVECNLLESEKNWALFQAFVQKNLYTATVAAAKFVMMEPDEFSGAKGAVACAIRTDMSQYVEQL